MASQGFVLQPHVGHPQTSTAAAPTQSSCVQSTAKQRYSLSDAELAPLGSLRKANPHKKDWQAMHLYLESQVQTGGEGACWEQGESSY
jgi:hypothetical protein